MVFRHLPQPEKWSLSNSWDDEDLPIWWESHKIHVPNQPGVDHDMFHKHSGYPQNYEAHHSGIGLEFLGSEAVAGVDFEDGRTLPTAKTPIEIAMDL